MATSADQVLWRGSLFNWVLNGGLRAHHGPKEAMMPTEDGADDHYAVIGQQMADALARERSHRAAWIGPSSPLTNVRYNSSKGEGDLLRLRPAQADVHITEFLTGVLGSTQQELDAVRGALTTDDFYALITYARRSVIHALRNAPPVLLGRGLAGLALIDPLRMDPRDLSWAIAVCAWGVRRIGLPREDALRDAQRLGTPSSIASLAGFLDDEIDLSDWGLVEISTPSGTGLAECEYARYDPTSNLIDAAFKIADAIAADNYEPATISVANHLPPVWFSGADQHPVREALGDVRATIAIRSRPRSDICENPFSQMLLVFLSECASGDDAATLAIAARVPSRSHHGAVAQRGRLLASMIARSVVIGTDSLETDETIERFTPSLRTALDAVALVDEPSVSRWESLRLWRRRQSR